MAVLVYSDSVDNPVIEALDRFARAMSPAAAALLFDQASNLIRTAGPAFSATGVQASVEHRIAGDNQIRVSYASGSALVMPAMPQPTPLTEVLAAAHPRRAQTYSISLSGTLDGSRTRWRASYRWQPDDTVTAVAPFTQDAAEPFLNVHFRQPIHVARDGSGGLEALLDIRNLLAEGYRPYILSDGSLLIFAQDQRSLRAGLAFTSKLILHQQSGPIRMHCAGASARALPRSSAPGPRNSDGVHWECNHTYPTDRRNCDEPT